MSNFATMTDLVRTIEKKRDESVKVVKERDEAYEKQEKELKKLEVEVPQLKTKLK